MTFCQQPELSIEDILYSLEENILKSLSVLINEKIHPFC